MENPRTLLNRKLFKPETAEKIVAMGELASQVADRWASGWPKQTQKLEQSGRLIEAITAQIEQERRAQDLEAKNPWMGGIETRQLAGLTDGPPES